MAGKHTEKSSKKPRIIAICVVAAVIVAVGILLVVNINNNSSTDNKNSQTTSAPVSTSAEETISQPPTVQQPKDETTAAKNNSSATEAQTTEKVVLPGDNHDVSYIEATYTPYKAVDTETNEECTLREVFGSSYSGGNLIFKDDGTFVDTIGTSSVDSGSYAIKDKSVTATYTNDKNMSIEVTQWSESTPTEFIVNYGGYDVYFN